MSHWRGVMDTTGNPWPRKDMESQYIREHIWIKGGDQEVDGVDHAHASYVWIEHELIHILKNLKTSLGNVSMFGRHIDDDGILHVLSLTIGTSSCNTFYPWGWTLHTMYELIWVLEGALFEALAYIIYIREMYNFSLVCTYKKAIKNFEWKVDV